MPHVVYSFVSHDFLWLQTAPLTSNRFHRVSLLPNTPRVRTVLHHTAQYGQTKTVKLMLSKRDVWVDAKDVYVSGGAGGRVCARVLARVRVQCPSCRSVLPAAARRLRARCGLSPTPVGVQLCTHTNLPKRVEVPRINDP